MKEHVCDKNNDKRLNISQNKDLSWDIGLEYGSDRDDYTFIDEVNYCPFCGEKLNKE